MSYMSPYKRVQQWMVFARQWWLFDAKQQDAMDAGQRIARYLHGRHKPIYDTEQDCGDHVVVINARHIAFPNNEWRHRYYFHHSHYAKGKKWSTAYELHEKDPNLVLYKSIYRAIGNIGLRRREMIARLHIYPDETIPPHIMENISDQIRQLRSVHRSIEEYDEEEIKNYPKIVDYDEYYTIRERFN
ncbi:39S ribosomal protein L13 [Sarcoptes scabiei]|uniref:39S ribosomal protein L13, mitochondrial n=1 Tax=Sarcoptes scabiei TaxID=52283 RepID=A0A132AID0_SARSC|nr:39S ribosomal protein L13 [Sarcoptes scabiei]KPM10325.1 39S ribosomal protein L13, mitochondrial-like protein [Sarcoptes scabiei]UXI16955.1 hypothetical protein NH340_JMT02898 [Sarcoptes scabiei]